MHSAVADAASGGVRGESLRHPRDPWDPQQYERFRKEREQPFWDLVALISPKKVRRVADLGCGTGALTRDLHRHLKAKETIGIDDSPAMLQRASAYEGHGVHFMRANIAWWKPPGRFDVVFSNAALQWVEDHPALFAHLVTLMEPGAVLAVQVPANFDHPSHTVAAKVALEEPFTSATGGYARVSPVLPPESYAELLWSLGLQGIDVRLQVYSHLLTSSADVVDWTRGTLLTDYEPRMPEEMFGEYVRRYRERLVGVLGDRRPYLFAFKRILMRAQAPAA